MEVYQPVKLVAAEMVEVAAGCVHCHRKRKGEYKR